MFSKIKEGRMRRMAVVFAAMTVIAVGCSSNESPTVQQSGSPAPAATAGVNNHGTKTFTTQTFTVPIEQDNFYFSPTYIQAPGASTATVQLKNEGQAEHTFTIDSLKVDVELKPGESKSVEVKIGSETRYDFYCRYHGDQGMRGAFLAH